VTAARYQYEKPPERSGGFFYGSLKRVDLRRSRRLLAPAPDHDRPARARLAIHVLRRSSRPRWIDLDRGDLVDVGELVHFGVLGLDAVDPDPGLAATQRDRVADATRHLDPCSGYRS